MYILSKFYDIHNMLLILVCVSMSVTISNPNTLKPKTQQSLSTQNLSPISNPVSNPVVRTDRHLEIQKNLDNNKPITLFFKTTEKCFDKAKEANVSDAKNADYIPQLSLANRDIFNVGAAIIKDGQVTKKVYSADISKNDEGDIKYAATIQSCSKMFTHLFAAEHSPELSKQVTGDCGTSLAFNSIMNYKEALIDPLILLSEKETKSLPDEQKNAHIINTILKELRETRTNTEFSIKLNDKILQLPNTGKNDVLELKEVLTQIHDDYSKFIKSSPNININAALNPSGNYGAILSVYTMFEPSNKILTPEIDLRKPLSAEFKEAVAQIKPHILKIESLKENIRDAVSKSEPKKISDYTNEITELQKRIKELRNEDVGDGRTRNQIIQSTGEMLVKPLNDFIVKLAQKSPEDTKPLKFDTDTFLSEIATAQGNEKLIKHMRKTCILPDTINPDKLLATYTAHCSLLGDVDKLTDALSTMANSGKNPWTGLQIVKTDAVKECLKNIRPSGAYTEVEEFMKNTGMHHGAIKTGVGGIILSCALADPEKKTSGHAIVTLSTPLNKQSNSARGMIFFKEFHKPNNDLIISKGKINGLEQKKMSAESTKILSN
jgi:glutaminase